jgi:hypothetical protein
MSISEQTKRSPFSDMSLWFLLFSNIATIFFAITEDWNLFTIMWVYWFQSVIIGFFNFIRILQLKEFSTKGFKINGMPAKPTQGTKFFTTFFFLFHFGFFHFIYLIFLLTDISIKASGNTLNQAEVKYILLVALLFFINHLFSYFYNKPRDTKKQNIASLMFYPYVRIIPIHMTIIFSALFSGALPLFLALKTFADVIMHVVEHKVLRKGEEQQTH